MFVACELFEGVGVIEGAREGRREGGVGLARSIVVWVGLAAQGRPRRAQACPSPASMREMAGGSGGVTTISSRLRGCPC